MYWKNINALKKVLIQGELPQKMQFWYVLVTFLIYEVFLEIASYIPSDDTSYLDYLSSIITVLMAILSVVFSYKANGSDNGKYFMQRYISINFVVSFRYGILIFFPIFILLIIGSAIVSMIYNIELFDKVIIFIFIAVLDFVVMYYTIKHVKDVAENFIEK